MSTSPLISLTAGLGYVRIGKVIAVPWQTVRSWVRHIEVPRAVSHGLAAARQKKEFPISKAAIRRNLIERQGNCCEGCGASQWRGMPLTLELHRLKAGNYCDVPLQLLCPNCHSVTENWRGKGKNHKLAPVA